MLGAGGLAAWSAFIGQRNDLIHQCLLTTIPQMQYSKWPPAHFGSQTLGIKMRDESQLHLLFMPLTLKVSASTSAPLRLV